MGFLDKYLKFLSIIQTKLVIRISGHFYVCKAVYGRKEYGKILKK